MAIVRPQDQPAAAALAGGEIVLVAQKSATVTISVATISAIASDNSINDSGNGFALAGFVAGMGLDIAGFTGTPGNNTDLAKAVSVTPGKIVVSGVTLVDDAAGETVTVCQLETVRTTALALSGAGGGNAYTPADASDWNGGVDPGSKNDALDQLADRTKALETLLGLGVNIPAQRYAIETANTTDSDPGAGLVKFNNATISSATMIYIDDSTSDGVDLSAYFLALGATGFVTLQSAADAGEWIIFRWSATTDGTGYWKFTVTHEASLGTLDDADAVLISFDSDVGGASSAGKHAVWISAAAMLPSVVGGCDPLAAIASASNQPDILTLNFDQTTAEYAQFSFVMPKSWDEGTVTFKAVWSHTAAGSHGVAWGLQGLALSDGDAIAQAFGTAVYVTDSGGTDDDVYHTAESSAITIAGTPAAEDLVMFRVSRDPSNGSDTMGAPARLHGIVLFITTDAATDA